MEMGLVEPTIGLVLADFSCFNPCYSGNGFGRSVNVPFRLSCMNVSILVIVEMGLVACKADCKRVR